MRKIRNIRFAKTDIRRVLLVCNGNIFRSLSAEFLLKHYLDDHKIKRWKVFSAGTIAKKAKMDSKVASELRKFGIKNLHHRQHKLSKPMLKQFDLVIAMAEDQVNFMKKEFNFKNAVLFNQLANNKKSSVWDIEDNLKDYANNRNGVEKEISKIIRHIHSGIPKLVKKILVGNYQ